MERFFERFFRSIRFDANWMQVNSTLGIEDTRAMILGADKWWKRCNSKECFSRAPVVPREITHSTDDLFRAIGARFSIVRQPYSPIRRLSSHLPLSFSKWSVGFSFRDCSLGTRECIVRKCVSGNVISPWNTREFNFLEIRGKKKSFVDLFLYGIITRWIHCFRLRRNIFALTCDPKCVGKKKRGRGKIYSMGKKKKGEKINTKISRKKKV